MECKSFILTHIFLIFLLVILMRPVSGMSGENEYDVVIYGGTSAAITAAVQATKMGKSVVIVSPDQHLGGLSSGGLGFTDTGNKAVIGGLSREFYHRIWQHYQEDSSWKWQKKSEYGNRGQGTPAIDQNQRTMWIFEPSAAELVFDRWIKEKQIRVVRNTRLNRESGVQRKQGRIVAFSTLDGKKFTGKMFIDATYEGDLMAAAGVSYHVGRESSDVYQERWNGVQTGVFHHGHWFKKPIDPYVVPGDPASGLLPRISSEPPGDYGSGDRRVQAYCFRMCLTNVPENRIPFPKPEGYDPRQYELMIRVLNSGWREGFRKFDPIPNRKTDTNNNGPFSTDNIGMNYDYPEGSYQRRAEIIHEHELYQKGLMYFLVNDPRVPADVREQMSQWGLARDEFVDNENWPHQIYVREARRMIGNYVMTEHECLGKRSPPNPVGMGSYTMDSHNVQRYVTAKGFVQNEGDIGVKGPPYQIDYGALVPRKTECENLLVPVAVSSSHIAFGSIRMEPVFMILGQSAATAACMSIDRNIAVQELEYVSLRKRLIADGQVLAWTHNEKSGGVDPARFNGVVIDDGKAVKKGTWGSSDSVKGFVGFNYIHDGNNSKGQKSVQFDFLFQKAGRYEILMSYTANPNRATNVPVRLSGKNFLKVVSINQRQKPSVQGIFESISTIDAGVGDRASVAISNQNTNGYVVVDSVWARPVDQK